MNANKRINDIITEYGFPFAIASTNGMPERAQDIAATYLNMLIVLGDSPQALTADLHRVSKQRVSKVVKQYLERLEKDVRSFREDRGG